MESLSLHCSQLLLLFIITDIRVSSVDNLSCDLNDILCSRSAMSIVLQLMNINVGLWCSRTTGVMSNGVHKLWNDVLRHCGSWRP